MICVNTLYVRFTKQKNRSKAGLIAMHKHQVRAIYKLKDYGYVMLYCYTPRTELCPPDISIICSSPETLSATSSTLRITYRNIRHTSYVIGQKLKYTDRQMIDRQTDRE